MDTQKLIEILISTCIPGFFGGVMRFMVSHRQNKYTGNKFIQELFINLIGSTITTTFISIMFRNNTYQPLIAFIIGVAWVEIIHLIKIKLLKIIEVTFGDLFNKK